MKKIIVIMMLALTLGCITSKKNNIIVSKKDLNQAEVALNELNEVLKRDNGKLWNHRLDGAILMINRETRTIIANEADEKGVLQKQGKLFVGNYPKDRNIANTVTEWFGKRWTMVTLPLPETKVKRVELIVHESFHRIQSAIGFDSLGGIQNLHLDKKKARIYIKLELEALKKALVSEQTEQHIKNALLFRQYRHQIYPNSKISENSLEMNEGLAEYTSSILSGRDAQALKEHYISQIDRFYNLPTFVRSFAYFTIPVYGYFMQKNDKKWNLRINKKTNLTDFIMNFNYVKPSNVSLDDFKRAGQIYNIDSISAIEDKREIEQLKIIENYRAKFITKNAFKINLEKMSIGFNPGNITPLDTFGTVYPYARITDNWGILKVDSGGVLLSPNWKQVTLSPPETVTDSLISGDGWNIKLNKVWRLKENNRIYTLVKK